jgi:putative MATE family efflux protein
MVIIQVFVAHGPGLGEHAVGAIGVCIPIVLMCSAISALTGAGAASRVSIFLGKNDKETACDILGNSFTLAILLSFFPLISTLFLEQILHLIGATGESYPFASDFLRYFLPFSVIVMVSVSLNSVMRASGHPKKALAMSVIGVISNLLLVPFFIFGLKWGTMGAAIAMNISNVIVLIPTLNHFLKKGSDLPLRFKSLKLKAKVAASILSIGFSPFFVQFTASIVTTMLNNRLSVYGGAQSVEAYAIANLSIVVFILILGGLSQGVQPIIGYNFGMKHYDRVFTTLKLTTGVGILIGLAGWLLMGIFFQGFFVGVFSPGDELYAQSVACLTIISIGLPLSGFQLVVSAFFQSIGSATIASVLSVSRQLVFLVPAIFILPGIWGIKGIWYSVPFSDALSTSLAIVILYFYVKKLKV